MLAGGATRTISVAEFEAWLAAAVAGDRIPYVTGLNIPRGSHVATAARQAYEAGLVVLVQDRKTGPRRYLAQRTSKPLPHKLIARVAARSQPKADTASDDADALFEALEMLVQRGRACPTNAALGEILNVPKWRVSRAFATLRSQGRIREDVEAVCWTLVRVVTISATGERSGMPSVPSYVALAA